MTKNVGYLSGTDPATLSQLTAAGVITIPLSNGWDNHGKYVGMLTVADNIGAIVGYFHKFVGPPETESHPVELLRRARIHKIPVVVVCPEKVMPRAREMLGEYASQVQCATPEQAYDEVTRQLGK
jgi:hypothetical protein